MILATARDADRPVRKFIASGNIYADCMTDAAAQLAEGEELLSVETLSDE